MSALTPDVEAVTVELNRLRRRATVALCLAAGSLATAAVALAVHYSVEQAGQRTPNQRTVEAGQFIVRDKDGKPRIELVVDDEKNVAYLLFFAKDGKPRVALASAEDAGLLMLGGPPNPRIELDSSRLFVSDEFLPFIDNLQKGKAEKGAKLAISAEGLEISDSDGKTRARLGVGEDGVNLSLLDANEHARVTLGSVRLETTMTGAEEETAESSLVLFDETGKVIFHAPR